MILTSVLSQDFQRLLEKQVLGKSILMGALSLIMGQRADTGLLKNKEKKCVVEGCFLIKDYNLQSFFAQNDLDYSDNIIVSS